ncbi:hypothetical protein JTB14_036646 [Gonioctena quinquepunctata]|nr:hypothetical protein JTB14_036646 [Gonioctena quinquepunctata]
MPENATEKQVSAWVDKFLRKEDFQEYRIEIDRCGGSGGYLGNIIFCKVVGTTHHGNRQKFLVVKFNSEQSIHFLNLAFKREIFIYEKLFPLFENLQLEKNVAAKFNSFPECYSTVSTNDQAVIILENLKNTGYRLYNKNESMDLHHQKLVFENYAKLHALSFALRDRNREEFEQISQSLPNVAKVFFEEETTEKAMKKYTKFACDLLRRKNEEKLAEKVDEILKIGPTKVVLDNILRADVNECVVTHGDSWNNNFLFKYEDDEAKPTQLAIIDWQLSSMHSPVLDLSLFTYTCSSEEELVHFEELITFYYSCFSNFLRELGGNPEKVFPFSKLKEHWYRYSVFPVIWMMTFLRIILSEEEEESAMIKEDMFDFPIRNEEEFGKRLIAVIKHYFTFQFSK